MENRELNLFDPKTVARLQREYGIRPLKSLGQNFLTDRNTAERIADAGLLRPARFAVEIGPGLGALTALLSRRFEKVAAVELDGGLIPLLRDILPRLGAGNVEIVNADALKVDFSALSDRFFGGEPFNICANLPYNITTEFIMRVLGDARLRSKINGVCLMLQKEAAARLTALPGGEGYGAASVFVSYHCLAERLFDVPPSCFYPAPKVTSAVLRMVPREEPASGTGPHLFERTVKYAFAHRRKTLLNSLASGFSGEFAREEISRALFECGVSPEARGETLSAEKFAEIAGYLEKLKENQ